MRKIAFILLTIVLSCTSKRETSTANSNIPESSDTAVIELNPIEPELQKVEDEPDEKFIPENLTVVTFDTLLAKLGLELTIEQSALESFVLDEFVIEGRTYRHKYRDFSIHLIGRENNNIVIDTVFFKDSFDGYIGEFLTEAHLSRYWFQGVENNELKFFGMVSKPETDIAFYFNQFVELNSWQLRTEQYVEEEI